jgi:hypothetical protein
MSANPPTSIKVATAAAAATHAGRARLDGASGTTGAVGFRMSSGVTRTTIPS